MYPYQCIFFLSLGSPATKRTKPACFPWLAVGKVLALSRSPQPVYKKPTPVIRRLASNVKSR